MASTIIDDFGRMAMSQTLIATLGRAAEHACAQGHLSVTIEHLLLALCEDPEAELVFATSNIDLARLKGDALRHLGNIRERAAAGQPHDVAVSPDLKRILDAAAAAAQGGRRREINGAIVLAAVVGDGKSPSAQMLRAQGLTFEHAIRALMSRPGAGQASTSAPTAPPGNVETPARQKLKPRPAPNLDRTDHEPADRDGTQARPEPAMMDAASAPAAEHTLVSGNPVASSTARAPATGKNGQSRPAEGLASAPAPAHASPEPARHVSPAATRPSASSSPARSPMTTDSARLPQRPPPLPPAAAGRRPPPGGYPVSASAPWPERLDQRPASARGRPVQNPTPDSAAREHGLPPSRDAAHAAPSDRHRPVPGVAAGQLVENIPRTMRVAVPAVVEVRIAKADVKALADGLQGGGGVWRHEVIVTKAMSVRLRAPEGGFWIETGSPETQWIENVVLPLADDFASWRWTVTPRVRGRKRLQLVVSARTVGVDGLTAETALPDQVIDVRVKTNYALTAARVGGWALAAVIGGLLARFGENALQSGTALVTKLMGG